jgi:hypothetical protein
MLLEMKVNDECINTAPYSGADVQYYTSMGEAFLSIII